MASRQSFNDSRRISRTKSLLGDSFKLGASVLGGLASSNKSIRHLSLHDIHFVNKDEFEEKNHCSLCFIEFGKINRRHHCRICGRSCCGDCSCSTINKQRACDICIFHYLEPQNQIIKDSLLQRFKLNALQYIGAKLYLEDESKALEYEIPSKEDLQKEKIGYQLRLRELQEELEQKKRNREELEREIAKVRSS